MKRVAAIFSIFLILQAVATNSCSAQDIILKIIDNGDDNARFVCVLLAEGYTAEESKKFTDDYTRIVNHIFSTSPWKEYKSFVNFYTLFRPSKQSGADHPSQNIYVDTAFDATFDSYGVSRLLTVNDSKAFDAAAQIPSFDAVFVLVNDGVYGGSAGSTIVFSCTEAAGDIALHEAGHFIGHLADEYETAYVAEPDITGVPNITRQTVIDAIPWEKWIDPEIPLPTPETITDRIGLFEGAGYSPVGIYRPKHTCKMRTLSAPYCEICAEAIIRSLYTVVRPVDMWGPLEPEITVIDQPLRLWIEPLPVTNGTFEVAWEVDGEIIANNGELNYSINPAALSHGTHVVRVWFKDTTPLVRAEADGLLTFQHAWQLYRTECSGDIAGTILQDDSSTGIANAMVEAVPSSAIAYTDENGWFQFSNLPCGTYTLIVNALHFDKLEKEVTVIEHGGDIVNIFLPTKSPSYNITGTIWGRIPGGVTVHVYGTVASTIHINGSRNFNLSSLGSGNYIIIPEATGHVFFPAFQRVTIKNASPPRIRFFAMKKLFDN